MEPACSHLTPPLTSRGEDWWYCYLDDAAFIVDGAPTFSHP